MNEIESQRNATLDVCPLCRQSVPPATLCPTCRGYRTVLHYTYSLQLDNGVTPARAVERTCPTCHGTGRV